MQDDWPFTHAAEVKLKQEAEANAKDAARYRWLRDSTNEMLPLSALFGGGEMLDAAIDKEMSK